MRPSTSSPAVLIACAAVLLLLVLAGPAAAHVTVTPAEAVADGSTKLAFRVGHGCEGSPTTSVRVRIPDGVVAVKPQVLDGWEITTSVGPYTDPVTLHGQELAEGVREVAWTGGRLDDAHMQEFAISATMPDAAGQTLHFPVLQTCEAGEHRWIEIPAAGAAEELEEPAPAVLLTAAVASAAADDLTAEGAALLLGLTGTVMGGVALHRSRS